MFPEEESENCTNNGGQLAVLVSMEKPAFGKGAASITFSLTKLSEQPKISSAIKVMSKVSGIEYSCVTSMLKYSIPSVFQIKFKDSP